MSGLQATSIPATENNTLYPCAELKVFLSWIAQLLMCCNASFSALYSVLLTAPAFVCESITRISIQDRYRRCQRYGYTTPEPFGLRRAFLSQLLSPHSALDLSKKGRKSSDTGGNRLQEICRLIR